MTKIVENIVKEWKDEDDKDFVITEEFLRSPEGSAKRKELSDQFDVADILDVKDKDMFYEYEDYGRELVSKRAQTIKLEELGITDFESYKKVYKELYPHTNKTPIESGIDGTNNWMVHDIESALSTGQGEFLSVDTPEGWAKIPFHLLGLNPDANTRKTGQMVGLKPIESSKFSQAIEEIISNPTRTMDDWLDVEGRVVEGTGQGTFFDHSYTYRNVRNSSVGKDLGIGVKDGSTNEFSTQIVNQAYSMIGRDITMPVGISDRHPEGVRYGNVCADAVCKIVESVGMPWPVDENGEPSSSIFYAIDAFMGKNSPGVNAASNNPGLSDSYVEVNFSDSVNAGDMIFLDGREHSVLVTQVYEDGAVEVVHAGGDEYAMRSKIFTAAEWRKKWEVPEKVWKKNQSNKTIGFRFIGEIKKDKNIEENLINSMKDYPFWYKP